MHFTTRWNSTSIVILYVLFVLMMLYHMIASLNERVRCISLAVNEKVLLTFMQFTVWWNCCRIISFSWLIPCHCACFVFYARFSSSIFINYFVNILNLSSLGFFCWFYFLFTMVLCQDVKRFKLGNPRTFHYLNQSNCYELDGVDDSKEYLDTRRAMDIVGISSDEQVKFSVWGSIGEERPLILHYFLSIKPLTSLFLFIIMFSFRMLFSASWLAFFI